MSLLRGSDLNTQSLDNIPASNFIRTGTSCAEGQVWTDINPDGTPICGGKTAMLTMDRDVKLIERNSTISLNGTNAQSIQAGDPLASFNTAAYNTIETNFNLNPHTCGSYVDSAGTKVRITSTTPCAHRNGTSSFTSPRNRAEPKAMPNTWMNHERWASLRSAQPTIIQ